MALFSRTLACDHRMKSAWLTTRSRVYQPSLFRSQKKFRLALAGGGMLQFSAAKAFSKSMPCEAISTHVSNTFDCRISKQVLPPLLQGILWDHIPKATVGSPPTTFRSQNRILHVCCITRGPACDKKTSKYHCPKKGISSLRNLMNETFHIVFIV